jgi:hypothetical protein
MDERMTPFAAHMLAHVFADASPVRVTADDDVEYLINRNANGWVVTLINNDGVFKPQQGMAQVDRLAQVHVTLTLRQGRLQGATNWITGWAMTTDPITVQLAAGGIAVVEIRVRP